MALKIPQNQIVKSQYTSGGEYMFVSTQNEYQGYYYELSGKLFAGKEFNTNNPEIAKIQSDKFNKLLGKASTYAYGKISGAKITNNTVKAQPNISNPSVTDVVDASTTNMNDTLISINTTPEKPKFYCSKINNSPILIKEIDEQTYINLQKDPLYKTTYVGDYNSKFQSVEDAEKQIPGLETFIG